MDVTEQESVRNVLSELREKAFNGSTEELAVALGRPVEEIEAAVEGTEPLDEDLEMKALELADHRGVAVEIASSSPS